MFSLGDSVIFFAKDDDGWFVCTQGEVVSVENVLVEMGKVVKMYKVHTGPSEYKGFEGMVDFVILESLLSSGNDRYSCVRHLKNR